MDGKARLLNYVDYFNRTFTRPLRSREQWPARGPHDLQTPRHTQAKVGKPSANWSNARHGGLTMVICGTSGLWSKIALRATIESKRKRAYVAAPPRNKNRMNSNWH